MATAAWVAWWPQLDGGLRLVGAVVVVATFGFAFDRANRAPARLRSPLGGVVVGTSALLLVLSTILEPRGSHDLWSYVLYGRIVAFHHTSPYAHAPAAFPHDPFFGQVAHGWRHTRSVYGPAFTAYSAAAARLAGTSAFWARVAHQGLAALSVATVGLSLAVRRHDVRPLLYLALNPAVVVSVNGGHNDLLVGAGVAAAVISARRGASVTAGVVAGCAASVKIIAIVPLAAIAIWSGFRRGPRSAVRCAVAGGAILVLGYVVAGGSTAVAPLLSGSGQLSRASLWAAPHKVVHAVAGVGLPPSVMLAVSLALVTAVAFVCRRRWLNATSPADAAVGTLTVLVLTLPYVLPWYTGWALPAASVVHDGQVARWARWLASALFVAYAFPPGDVSAAGVVALVGQLALPCCAAMVAASWLASRNRDEATPQAPTSGVAPADGLMAAMAPARSRA